MMREGRNKRNTASRSRSVTLSLPAVLKAVTTAKADCKALILQLLISLSVALCLTTFAQNEKIAPRLIVKPVESLPIGSTIDVEVGLFGNNDRPLDNNVIEVYLGGEYIRRSRTDENGTAKIRVSRDLPLGNYELTVHFVGTRDYLETQTVLPIVIRPIYITVETVPPLPGINFQLGEQHLASNEQGLARFEVTTSGVYALAALVEPNTLINPDTKVTFARWGDESFTPQRTVEIFSSDVHMQIGFALSHPIQTKFVDLSGEAIEWARVTKLTLKSSSAAYRTIENAEPYWLQANRILRQRTGIFPTEILWSVESVILDGSNVVNRYQQRYYVKPNDLWTIQLLVYQARITSKDALFGVPVGTGVTLTYPDGSTNTHAFDENGQLAIFDMARGQYKMKVEGASGVAPLTPVALTKDQDVELKVFSGLDIGALVALGLFIALGLLFYGRPHLMMLRSQSTLAAPMLALPERTGHNLLTSELHRFDVTLQSSNSHRLVQERLEPTPHVRSLAEVLLFAASDDIASDDIEVEKQTIVLEDKLPARTETVPSKHEAESLTTQLGQAAECCFGVELLEPVLTSHLKAVAPPLAKKLHIQNEKVMERLSLPPGLITKPMSFAKAIALSEILREYGVRTRVSKLDTLQPSLFEENSQEGKRQKRG
jgi:hypothetical protein